MRTRLLRPKSSFIVSEFPLLCEVVFGSSSPTRVCPLEAYLPLLVSWSILGRSCADHHVSCGCNSYFSSSRHNTSLPYERHLSLTLCCYFWLSFRPYVTRIDGRRRRYCYQQHCSLPAAPSPGAVARCYRVCSVFPLRYFRPSRLPDTSQCRP
jgi:hypothetical protein